MPAGSASTIASTTQNWAFILGAPQGRAKVLKRVKKNLWKIKNQVIYHQLRQKWSKGWSHPFVLPLTNDCHKNLDVPKLGRNLGLRPSGCSQMVKRQPNFFLWQWTNLKTDPGYLFPRDWVGYTPNSKSICVKILPHYLTESLLGLFQAVQYNSPHP